MPGKISQKMLVYKSLLKEVIDNLENFINENNLKPMKEILKIKKKIHLLNIDRPAKWKFGLSVLSCLRLETGL